MEKSHQKSTHANHGNQSRVQFNTNESRTNGVSGTPTFFIIGPDNQQITINGPQPFSVFKNVIEPMMLIVKAHQPSEEK